MTKLVILDRDGVINVDSPNFIKNPDEWIPLPGSLEAISLLNQKGYLVAIATNQSGIGRGLYSEHTLHLIHLKMHQALQDINAQIHHIEFCPHLPSDHCQCRKPLPGMLKKIAHIFSIPLYSVPVVGDSLRDLQAASAVQASPILVLTGNGSLTSSKQLPTATSIHPDLYTFAKSLP